MLLVTLDLHSVTITNVILSIQFLLNRTIVLKRVDGKRPICSLLVSTNPTLVEMVHFHFSREKSANYLKNYGTLGGK
jgi:hypothetical protein